MHIQEWFEKHPVDNPTLAAMINGILVDGDSMPADELYVERQLVKAMIELLRCRMRASR